MNKKKLMLFSWKMTTFFIVNRLSAQAFIVDDTTIPFDGQVTQEVACGDVDLDGDWDILLANGDEDSPAQNRVWINQGGIQGAQEGVFFDETSSRLPLTSDTTFDLCLGDIDADGDADVHVSNSSHVFLLWGNRWWINLGGMQGGTLGYFEDQTASRWIGLGQPGSSIPPYLLKDGTFLDDCRDSEFADLDNDGDLDLIHSSYWMGAPHQPARLFLNDGDGRFEELNPPGVMTPSGTLLEGGPCVWCEGVYDNQTADSSGTFCDPTTVSWDVDAGDLDGDLDLDLVFADDWYEPGVFANRLEGSALAPASGIGAPAFRDVWGAVLSPGYGANEDNCQELGDLDGDGDLDLVGGDYLGSLSTVDAVLEHVGGIYVQRATLSSVGQKVSAKLFDHDGDGDLDFLSVGDTVQLHSNVGGFVFAEVQMPSWSPEETLDADVADLDGDGDLDIIAATEGGEGEHLLLNQSDLADGHAPILPLVEDIADRTVTSTPFALRAHVYDNAPHGITADNSTRVEVKVDGVVIPPFVARSAGGQVFRAEMPGNLVGQVSYRFLSEDESGNVGASVELSYVSTSLTPFQAAYGTATTGLSGGAPLLRAISAPVTGTTLHLALSTNAPPGTLAVIGVGTVALNPGVHIPGLLFLQVSGQVLAVVPMAMDIGSDAVLSVKLGVVPPGLNIFAQGFVLDPTAMGESFASSKGLSLMTL